MNTTQKTMDLFVKNKNLKFAEFLHKFFLTKKLKLFIKNCQNLSNKKENTQFLKKVIIERTKANNRLIKKRNFR